MPDMESLYFVSIISSDPGVIIEETGGPDSDGELVRPSWKSQIISIHTFFIYCFSYWFWYAFNSQNKSIFSDDTWLQIIQIIVW